MRFDIMCAACGEDEDLRGVDKLQAAKDARVRGWVFFPQGFNGDPGLKGWVCADCNPDAPPRLKLKPDALALQRNASE